METKKTMQEEQETLGCRDCFYCDKSAFGKTACCTYPGQLLVLSVDGACKRKRVEAQKPLRRQSMNKQIVKKISGCFLGEGECTIAKDGLIKVKSSYFYKNGRTAEKYSMACKESIENATGMQVRIVDAIDDWRVWPKTSYFRAVLELTGGTQ